MKALVSILSLSLAGCASQPAPVPPAPPPPAAASAGSPSTPAPPLEPAAPTPSSEAPDSSSGALSEAEFKALHELKPGAAPHLRGNDIALPGGSRAYLSLPEGSPAPHTAVVVIHEWWGLNDHLRHWADRVAADEHAALAVDLYAGKTATTPDEAMALMKSVDESAARATLKDALSFLEKDLRVRAHKRAALGWCFGGKWALNAALLDASLSAAVIYYGHVPHTAQALAGLKSPVLGIFGARDSSIPLEHVRAFDEALDQVGVEHTILTYDAEHAFANPSGARYHAEAAEKAWDEARRFLTRHLKGGH